MKNQEIIIANKESYSLKEDYGNSGSKYYIIKLDNTTKKETYKLDLNIPNKNKRERCFSPVNKISTLLLGNDI